MTLYTNNNITDVLENAIHTYGVSLQLVIAIEEMAELTQAISKSFRGEENRDDIIGEVADVIVMLEQIILIYNLDHQDIENMIQERLARLERKLLEE